MCQELFVHLPAFVQERERARGWRPSSVERRGAAARSAQRLSARVILALLEQQGQGGAVRAGLTVIVFVGSGRPAAFVLCSRQRQAATERLEVEQRSRAGQACEAEAADVQALPVGRAPAFHGARAQIHSNDSGNAQAVLAVVT